MAGKLSHASRGFKAGAWCNFEARPGALSTKPLDSDSRGRPAFYFFFHHPGAANQPPIVLDTTALEQAGGEYLLRAEELRVLFEKWQAKQSTSFLQNDTLRRYLRRYEHFSPIVVLPIPAFADFDAVPKYLGEAPTDAIIAARRLIVARIRGREGAAPIASSGWPVLALGRDFWAEPLNSSPIDEGRFTKLMKHVRRVLRSRLDAWDRAAYNAERRDTSLRQVSTFTKLAAGSGFTFVSYARREMARVNDICGALKQRGAKLWIDTESIEGGEDFIQRLVEGIDGCDRVLPFCSRLHSNSEYCFNEVFYAHKHKKNIVPAWLTNPALHGRMDFLLGPKNATLVNGLDADAAATRIRPTLGP